MPDVTNLLEFQHNLEVQQKALQDHLIQNSVINAASDSYLYFYLLTNKVTKEELVSAIQDKSYFLMVDVYQQYFENSAENSRYFATTHLGHDLYLSLSVLDDLEYGLEVWTWNLGCGKPLRIGTDEIISVSSNPGLMRENLDLKVDSQKLADLYSRLAWVWANLGDSQLKVPSASQILDCLVGRVWDVVSVHKSKKSQTGYSSTGGFACDLSRTDIWLMHSFSSESFGPAGSLF